ncbi:MAG: hypothetical protein NTV80_05165 [Verrucomicrobia bacterium]|nr:hypothetical protein [Verrucomicrobiota bacterium]
MEPSFEKLLVLLTRSEIQFIVVGGIAVTLHGYVRLTEDVGVLIESSRSNVEQLLTTLSGYGEGFAAELSADDFDDSEGAIRIVEESEQCQIDIFTRMSGRQYADVIIDADTFNLHGMIIRFASKAALIGWKGNSVREKDRLDAIALRRLDLDPRAFD